jgi:hypothetical protein
LNFEEVVGGGYGLLRGEQTTQGDVEEQEQEVEVVVVVEGESLSAADSGIRGCWKGSLARRPGKLLLPVRLEL